MNRTILMGNLCRDVELRYLQNGTAVADASIAVNDRVKKGADWVDEASFFDLTLWGRTAEIAAEHTRKGTRILVEGRLKQETWDDKDSGARRSKIKVVVDRLYLVGAREQRHEPADTTEAGDEIPF